MVGGAPIIVSAASATDASRTIVATQQPNVGEVLMDAKGMTFFKKDKPGESVCGRVRQELAASDHDRRDAARRRAGGLGHIGSDRAQGWGYQVTYDAMPLSYIAKDTKPGDVNGRNVHGMWFVAPARPSAMSAHTESPKPPAHERGGRPDSAPRLPGGGTRIVIHWSRRSLRSLAAPGGRAGRA